MSKIRLIVNVLLICLFSYSCGGDSSPTSSIDPNTTTLVTSKPEENIKLTRS